MVARKKRYTCGDARVRARKHVVKHCTKRSRSTTATPARKRRKTRTASTAFASPEFLTAVLGGTRLKKPKKRKKRANTAVVSSEFMKAVGLDRKHTRKRKPRKVSLLSVPSDSKVGGLLKGSALEQIGKSAPIAMKKVIKRIENKEGPYGKRDVTFHFGKKGDNIKKMVVSVGDSKQRATKKKKTTTGKKKRTKNATWTRLRGRGPKNVFQQRRL